MITILHIHHSSLNPIHSGNSLSSSTLILIHCGIKYDSYQHASIVASLCFPSKLQLYIYWHCQFQKRKKESSNFVHIWRVHIPQFPGLHICLAPCPPSIQSASTPIQEQTRKSMEIFANGLVWPKAARKTLDLNNLETKGRFRPVLWNL